ncbi:DoxX family protein [Gordonia sp. TBRC 11910]|uniref:DoxX family protein n=1 Tax=Gordonia asplenii TaxID=2725283 RepID=A0A848L044_9ACTN|nr:DoxX family protein [Gordonia asplenii]NMO01058.1 DoxX family protein [Gordonia asplenii]
MNVALWIIAIVLAVAMGLAGLMKVSQSKEKLAAAGLRWVEDFSPNAVKTIGALEVLGAIGLFLPAVTNIAPILVPVAAVCVALVMVGAIVVHARRSEFTNIPVNVVLLILAVVVAWGRFGSYAF